MRQIVKIDHDLALCFDILAMHLNLSKLKILFYRRA